MLFFSLMMMFITIFPPFSPSHLKKKWFELLKSQRKERSPSGRGPSFVVQRVGMAPKKRKAEGGPMTECPITGLPINDKLVKKLKSSTQVTKATLANTLKSKLGWAESRVQDSWSKDTLIQEYYTALEMQMQSRDSSLSPARTSLPSSPGSPVRQVRQAPAPSRPSAQSVNSGGRRSSAIGRGDSTPPASRRVSGASAQVRTPETRPQIVQSERTAPKKTAPTAGGGGSFFGTMVKLLFILMAAMLVVIFLVHGFEGGKKGLIDSAKGDVGKVVANYRGFAELTLKGLWELVVNKATAANTLVWDHMTKLWARLSGMMNSALSVHAAPKDGLVAAPKKPEKPKAEPKVSVATAQNAKTDVSEAEKARLYEERKKAAEKKDQEDAKAAAARQAEAEAREKQKAQAQAQAEQQPNKQRLSDTDTEKVMAMDCDSFDVYDCDVEYPKHFDTCRKKKDECDRAG